MALCATTALAGAVPRLCVCGARGRLGGFGPVPGVVSLSFPPSRPACSALRVAGCPVRVSLTLARWYAIPRGLCVPRARSCCPSGSPRVPVTCVCARAPAASAPPPSWVVWRAHLARSRHWALVGPFHVVRAPPRVLPRSLAPSCVLGGGRSGPGSSPSWLGVAGEAVGRPPGGLPSTVARGVWGQALPLPRLPVHWAGCWGPLSTCCGRGRAGVGALLCPLGLHALWGLRAAGRVRGVCVPGGGLGGGGGGGGVPRTPRLCGWGGACRAGGRSASFRPSAFPGQATMRVSVALFCPWGAWPPITVRFVLARLFWVRSVRRPGALARARLFSAAPVGAGGWGRGAGRAPAPLSGGVGDQPPLPRGVGAGAPAACGPAGGFGGGVVPRPPCPPSGWRPAVLQPGPPRVAGALLSGVRVRSGSRCRPGMGRGEGRPVDRSPGGPCRPEPPLCPP